MSDQTFTKADLDSAVAAAVATALKPFEGVDAADYKKLKDAEVEKNRKALEEKGNYEKLLADKDAAHTTELSAMRQKLDAERTKNALSAELSKHPVVKGAAPQVIALLGGKVRATDAGAIEVLGDDGKPATKDGKAVTLDALVSGFLEQNAHFVSAGEPGSGSRGSDFGKGGAKTMKRRDFDALSTNEKHSVIGKGTKIVD